MAGALVFARRVRELSVPIPGDRTQRQRLMQNQEYHDRRRPLLRLELLVLASRAGYRPRRSVSPSYMAG